MQPFLKNSSALLLFLAPLILAWRVWGLFPTWLLGLLLSSSMSLFLLFLSFRREGKAYHQLKEELALLSPLSEELKEAKERVDCLQISLDQTLDELRILRHQLHFEKETLQSTYFLQSQHLQLRKQFVEKGEILKETRRALFELEGRYSTLEREKKELSLARRLESEASEEIASLSLEESAQLKMQVEELEALITALLSQKKSKSTKKKIENELEFHF